MQWPNPQEYNEAIQSPALCFRDAELRSASVQTNNIGLPRPTTGAFASVYKLSGRGQSGDCHLGGTEPAGDKGGSIQSWAVRLFHREVPDQKVRYSHISTHLQNMKLPFISGFRFEDQGVRVRGQWYPMLKMEWVEGVTLDEYMRKNAANPDKMRQLARAFKEMVGVLHEHGIAHGDLQHGNIMITAKGIVLVDYDGMYVPSMLGWASAELGHKNYQHPYRSIEHFGNYTDNFSQWLIHTSLMMIAADCDLWRWGKDRECLIFTHADLIKPEESPLFEELSRNPHPQISDAARLLIRLSNCPVELVPPLSAGLEQLQDLPQMDFMQQMQLKDKIEQEDASRATNVASAIAALETLSVRQQMPSQRISKLWQGVSRTGGAWINSVFSQMQSAGDANALTARARAEDLFDKGSYAEAAPIYITILDRLTKKAKSTSQKETARFELNLTSYLNLQIGKSYVLSGDSAKSIFYFRSVLRLKQDKESFLQVMEAGACLLVAYCELDRVRDADALLNVDMPLSELSVAMVQCADTPLSASVGWNKAMLLIGEQFEAKSEWHRACTVYECALTSSRYWRETEEQTLSDTTLGILVHLSRCHLYSKRPLIAVRCLQSVMNNKTHLDQDLFERAALNLAVAYRQTESRQDMISVLMRCNPRRLLRMIRQEMRTPLGLVPELADVVNAMALQLGEVGRSEEARQAVRLSADIYKNAEYQQQAIEISILLQDGMFEKADALAEDRDVFMIEGVKEQFRNAAVIYAANLIRSDKTAEAFTCLAKYDCPVAIAISAIEDRVRLSLRQASREGWEGEGFTRALKMMTELATRQLLSPDLRQLVISTLLSEPHQIESLPTAVREFADFFSSTVDGGSSHPDVLRLRRLALNIEETQAAALTITPADFLQRKMRSGPTGGGLSGAFGGAIRASAVSAGESKNRAGMETEVLKHVSTFMRDGVTVELEMAATLLSDMQTQGVLNSKFCDKVADLLMKYFADSSGMRRWRMSASNYTTEERRQQVGNAIVSVMATVNKIEGHSGIAMSNLKRCISFVTMP